MKSVLFRKLFPNKSETDFPSGYIPNKFFVSRVKRDPVLIIGDYTGREYYSLKRKFKRVYLLDVVDNNIAEKDFFIHQSVTEPIPFPDGFFHYIIMSEVLEHIWEDKKTLEELRRVLHPEGRLLLSVPFFNDFPEYHYHIYSPKTLRILLRHSGFEIAEEEFRGIVVGIPNEIIALFAMMLYPFFRERALEKVNCLCYKVHQFFSRFRLINSFCRYRWPFLRGYGVLLSAKKSEEFVDSINVQIKSFKK